MRAQELNDIFINNALGVVICTTPMPLLKKISLSSCTGMTHHWVAGQHQPNGGQYLGRVSPLPPSSPRHGCAVRCGDKISAVSRSASRSSSSARASRSSASASAASSCSRCWARSASCWRWSARWAWGHRCPATVPVGLLEAAHEANVGGNSHSSDLRNSNIL